MEKWELGLREKEDGIRIRFWRQAKRFHDGMENYGLWNRMLVCVLGFGVSFWGGGICKVYISISLPHTPERLD